MLTVIVAWVFFRATTFQGAGLMLQGMAGVERPAGAVDGLLWNAGLKFQVGMGWCAVLGAVAFLLPNSNLVGERVRGLFARSAGWRVALGTASACVGCFLVVLNTVRDSVSAFIYFNF